MKTLSIVRHAKSSWDFAGLHDYERPLNETGTRRTAKVIEFLNSKKTIPDLILTSHAVRAHETARLLAHGLNYHETNIQVMKNIYEGIEEDLLQNVLMIPDEKKSVMIVGHNPSITEFANEFLKTPIEWLSTSGIVCIEFKTDAWKNILTAKRKTKFIVTPKLLREGKINFKN